MREIIFRGKRLYNGKWAEGSLVRETVYYGDPIKERDHIIIGGEFDDDYYWAEEVDPSTVGQFTGLTDKNGKKIFEGDIVRCEDTRYEFTREFCGVVVYKNGAFAINDDEITRYRLIDYEMEVIGNIHDNPGLLEA